MKGASTQDDFVSSLQAWAISSLEPTVTFSQRSLSVVRSASSAMFSGVVLSICISPRKQITIAYKALLCRGRVQAGYKR